ncbi:sigma-54-dependent Fis family transcriptional regulator [Devosia faecipullorum]|uniref:sigma-54-dependent Fis family transcriptional regulator n=1 Tax=Devosia faecipullorum TaxID=2755039 RepID=UPI00187BAEF1|nr:sigma-54-dependent Fis family transcriptional regulator [Devosia faecipullorum]MBE7733964.1 sigma-54-dependent Fis family transcriptional regulator [Devosia faecipullorum]
MNLSSDLTLAAAREKFFSGHVLPEGLVPAPILRSWQRCAEQGLDAGDNVLAEPMTAGELRQLQQQNETLRLMSRPELMILRAEARLTDSVVILTDAKGTLLDVVGSAEFAGAAARVALQPGVAWSENSTGTNAIGTAMAERRAIAVHGGEHFFEPHGILHCAAAPIIDPFGKLAGVLDMSGHADAGHTHALGLVRLAVEQIEHRFFARGFEDKTVLRFHKLGDLLGTPREGVLVFDGDRLLAGNRRALSLLGLDRLAFRKTTSDELFERLDTDLRSVGGERFSAIVQRPEERPQASLHPVSGMARQSGPYMIAETRADLERAIKLVNADIPVLVSGPTGSGKEVFARHLAERSSRAGKPFVAVNCAALPESLIEAELFGYEAGAFTGARKGGARGLVSQAEGGILFLDEIGDMPLLLQSRLLRVLQDKQVSPLGGGPPKKTDFVAICATNRDLKAMVDAGTFRADLYFRIAQVSISLPAVAELPERRALIEYLWQAHEAGHGRLPDAVLDRLEAHDWPGNLRELANTLHATSALAGPGQRVGLDDLPNHIQPPARRTSPLTPSGELGELTEAAMRRVVELNRGNLSAAARALGIDRSTLYRRLVWAGKAN